MRKKCSFRNFASNKLFSLPLKANSRKSNREETTEGDYDSERFISAAMSDFRYIINLSSVMGLMKMFSR